MFFDSFQNAGLDHLPPYLEGNGRPEVKLGEDTGWGVDDGYRRKIHVSQSSFSRIAAKACKDDAWDDSGDHGLFEDWSKKPKKDSKEKDDAWNDDLPGVCGGVWFCEPESPPEKSNGNHTKPEVSNQCLPLSLTTHTYQTVILTPLDARSFLSQPRSR